MEKGFESMTVPPSDNVILGVTHLSLCGGLVRLLKCPFCNFRNIHEDEIKHHIRYKDDPRHNVAVDKIDKKTFIVTKKESPYHYEKKEDLPMPWIQCLWCDYRDKVERDLEWHFLEKHRKKLYRDIKITTYERKRAWRNDPFAFMYIPMDYRLEKAVALAKKNSLALSCQKEQNDSR